MILNMKDLPGGKLPPSAVYVGRPRGNGYPLHFGNPFGMSDESQRDKACNEFGQWLTGEYYEDDVLPVAYDRLQWISTNIVLLHGRDLACWCAPKRCHAETLAELAAQSSDKPVFRLIVAGGRDFADYKMLSAHLDKLLENKAQTHTVVIISGLARGADLLGKRYGEEHGYHVVEFPAFWGEQGKSAGYKRNAAMRQYTDAVVCFWNGQSKGTGEMINTCKQEGLPIRVVNY
jgi:hypothetical protein